MNDLELAVLTYMPLMYVQQLRKLISVKAAPDPDKRKAKVARMAHARATRTADLHAVIDVYVEKYRKQLRDWKESDSKSNRAKWLVRLMKADAGEGDVVPHWRYVYNYLNTLQL